ncbi:MAG: hypothetical protein H7Y38_01125 [Armatimonadetes bacterium]|nr:hypothetical protein [Armatimonadota bacterium]
MQLLPMTRNAATNDAVLLSRTRVASPCRADWDAMVGDERSRFCGSCRKNVYNLSAMTTVEAAALIREKEGKLCVRYFERADGTVLTQDCPVGLAAVRRRMARVFAAGIVGFAALFSAATQWWITDTGENLFANRLRYWAEKIHPTPEPAVAGKMRITPEPGMRATGGATYVPKLPEPEAIMGEAPIYEPETPVKTVRVGRMGRMAPIMGAPRIAPSDKSER